MALRLVLASQSAARRRLLKKLGVRFSVRPAHLDEAAIQKTIRGPRRLVRELARMKAASVAATMPRALVIGSDQVLVCDGKVFGKPLTVAGACRQLAQFSGRWIQLQTAVCVREPSGREHAYVHLTKMKFRVLSRSEIASYVELDQPLECAGSFKFELHGIALFEKVVTDDPTAIEGLPLLKVAEILRSLGVFRAQS